MRVAWVDDVASIRWIGQRLVERSGGTCVGFEDHALREALGPDAERGEVAS